MRHASCWTAVFDRSSTHHCIRVQLGWGGGWGADGVQTRVLVRPCVHVCMGLGGWGWGVGVGGGVGSTCECVSIAAVLGHQVP
jgi:hypothetical protein